MAIPWLIGGAVLWAGKKIYNSYEEDERRERAERIAREERREREAAAKKQRELANKREQLRIEKQQQQLLKDYVSSQSKTLLQKYKISSLNPDNLANLAITESKNTIVMATKSYMESKVNKELTKNVATVEKELDEITELELLLQGL